METQVSSMPKASKAKTKGNIPTKDLDLKTVARTASNKWLGNSKLTLQWTTAADFKTTVDAFELCLNERTTAGNSRMGTVRDLFTLNKTIDEHLAYVKNYIEDEYGKEKATAHYAEFGIEHIASGYRLPIDSNQRQNALQFLLKGLTDMGWTEKRYGTAFWTPLVTEYDTLFNATTQTVGTIAKSVQDKNECRTAIKDTLNALVLLIKANYPNTYVGELRDWGFQKEKY